MLVSIEGGCISLGLLVHLSSSVNHSPVLPQRRRGGELFVTEVAPIMQACLCGIGRDEHFLEVAQQPFLVCQDGGLNARVSRIQHSLLPLVALDYLLLPVKQEKEDVWDADA